MLKVMASDVQNEINKNHCTDNGVASLLVETHKQVVKLWHAANLLRSADQTNMVCVCVREREREGRIDWTVALIKSPIRNN